MTAMEQVKGGLAKEPAEYGVSPLRGLGQHTGIMGALLITVGAVVALAMALTGVRRLGLWTIPTILYMVGTLLLARPPAKS